MSAKFLTKNNAYQQFGYFYRVNLLRRLFDFYLDASIHVALSVFSLVWITGYVLDIIVDIHLAFFLFFGTIASYNFIKYGLEAEKYILVANRYHKNIQFFSFAAVAGAIYHAWFLIFDTWIGLSFLAILTGLYAIPVLPNTKNLRSWSGFKVFPVALVWAGATVLLPVVQIKGLITWDVKIEALQRFLIVLALLIPFEIRDLSFDAAELRTIPQRFGVGRTKIIGVILASIIFSVSFFKDDLTLLEIGLKTTICLTLVFAILFSEKHRSKYYATFWVELLPIAWLAIARCIFDAL